MTDNEIIKTLECCTGLDHFKCAHCHLIHTVGCSSKLKKYALDLINRQKAELERLERHTEMYHEVRAEAVKEFAEELKEQVEYLPRLELDGTNYFLVSKRFIGNLVKEKVGETE